LIAYSALIGEHSIDLGKSIVNLIGPFIMSAIEIPLSIVWMKLTVADASRQDYWVSKGTEIEKKS
jgi:hypothetical protein